MPPGGSKAATRADITKLDAKIGGAKSELKADITRLDAKMDGAKSELKGDIARLAVGLLKTDARIGRVEDALRAEMSANTDRIMTAIDGLAKLVQADNRAVVIHGRALTDHADTPRRHEERLSTLEAKQ